MDKGKSVSFVFGRSPFSRARLRPMPGIARGPVYDVAPPPRLSVVNSLTSKSLTGKNNAASENYIERSSDYSARAQRAIRPSAAYRSGVRGDDRRQRVTPV